MFDIAIEISAKRDDEIIKPRNAGRHVHGENVPADTLSQ